MLRRRKQVRMRRTKTPPKTTDLHLITAELGIWRRLLVSLWTAALKKNILFWKFKEVFAKEIRLF